MQDDTCAHCAGAFQRRASNQRFCSARCREAARAVARGGWYVRRPSANGGKYSATCPACGTGFASDSRSRVYCSDRCKWRAKARRQHGHVPMVRQSSTCTTEGCGRDSLARSLCPVHYMGWRRAQGLRGSSAGGGRRRAAGHIARAKHYGVPWERFTPVDVFDRDGWVCGICDAPVDPALEYPDPLSVSLDHVIPLAQGGGHLMDNCQCSHLECNLRKERGRRRASARVAQ